MVLNAVLALGSTFNEFGHGDFAQACVKTAIQHAAQYESPSAVAVVQARLILGAHYHLKGNDDLAWFFDGSGTTRHQCPAYQR